MLFFENQRVQIEVLLSTMLIPLATFCKECIPVVELSTAKELVRVHSAPTKRYHQSILLKFY